MTTRPEIALPEPAQPPSNFTSRRAARLAREGPGSPSVPASTSTTRSPRPVTLTPAPCEPATTQTPTSP